MPQMAPLNWLILFTFFSSIFLLFNLMNYYTFTYSPKTSSGKKMKLNFNWKW